MCGGVVWRDHSHRHPDACAGAGDFGQGGHGRVEGPGGKRLIGSRSAKVWSRCGRSRCGRAYGAGAFLHAPKCITEIIILHLRWVDVCNSVGNIVCERCGQHPCFGVCSMVCTTVWATLCVKGVDSMACEVWAATQAVQTWVWIRMRGDAL